MNTQNKPKITSTSIVNHLKSGGSFSTAQVLIFQKQKELISKLIVSFLDQSPKLRKEMLLLLTDMGRPVIKARKELPERLAPYISRASVIKLLVRSLLDNDRDIRNLACNFLVDEVPDILIRNHLNEVINSIRKYPNVDRSTLLLGKMGAEISRKMIMTIKEIYDADKDNTYAALGRLGDRQAEDKLIRKYLTAEDHREKAKYALKLGYMATIRSTLTLARDIRTSDYYIWRMKSRRSMRVHIIEGLSLAFPTEPVFWKSLFKPTDDSYYEKIENWLTCNLGVTWNQSRPAFLYEEDSPVLPNK